MTVNNVEIDDLEDIQRYCDNVIKLQNQIHDIMDEIETNMQFLKGMIEKVKSK